MSGMRRLQGSATAVWPALLAGARRHAGYLTGTNILCDGDGDGDGGGVPRGLTPFSDAR